MRRAWLDWIQLVFTYDLTPREENGMRPYQIFGSLSPEHNVNVMRAVSRQAPAAFAQAVVVASSAMKARPVYLQRMPFERRAEAVRRALARVGSDELAEDLLAVYFLECRRELLVEWLDTVGVKHEDGTLEEEAPPCPSQEGLREALRKFRTAGKDGEDRELLLRAFAAQRAIEWPLLESCLGEGE